MAASSAPTAGTRARAVETSDSRVPLVALVFPVAAVAAVQLRKALHRLDAHHVVRMLVAELARDAQAHGRTVRNRQRLVVQLVGQQRLFVERVVEVDALV